MCNCMDVLCAVPTGVWPGKLWPGVPPPKKVRGGGGADFSKAQTNAEAAPRTPEQPSQSCQSAGGRPASQPFLPSSS